MSEIVKTSPVGDNWESYKAGILTDQERNEIELKVSLITEILNARQEKRMTQNNLRKKAE